jgi:hypothetical protein
MKRERKQFLIWTSIAGVLFLMVGVHDLLFLTTSNKSGYIIALELIAGILFLLNALLQWRKYRS